MFKCISSQIWISGVLRRSGTLLSGQQKKLEPFQFGKRKHVEKEFKVRSPMKANARTVGMNLEAYAGVDILKKGRLYAPENADQKQLAAIAVLARTYKFNKDHSLMTRYAIRGIAISSQLQPKFASLLLHSLTKSILLSEPCSRDPPVPFLSKTTNNEFASVGFVIFLTLASKLAVRCYTVLPRANTQDLALLAYSQSKIFQTYVRNEQAVRRTVEALFTYCKNDVDDKKLIEGVNVPFLLEVRKYPSVCITFMDRLANEAPQKLKYCEPQHIACLAESLVALQRYAFFPSSAQETFVQAGEGEYGEIYCVHSLQSRASTIKRKLTALPMLFYDLQQQAIEMVDEFEPRSLAVLMEAFSAWATLDERCTAHLFNNELHVPNSGEYADDSLLNSRQVRSARMVSNTLQILAEKLIAAPVDEMSMKDLLLSTHALSSRSIQNEFLNKKLVDALMLKLQQGQADAQYCKDGILVYLKSSELRLLLSTSTRSPFLSEFLLPDLEKEILKRLSLENLAVIGGKDVVLNKSNVLLLGKAFSLYNIEGGISDTFAWACLHHLKLLLQKTERNRQSSSGMVISLNPVFLIKATKFVWHLRHRRCGRSKLYKQGANDKTAFIVTENHLNIGVDSRCCDSEGYYKAKAQVKLEGKASSLAACDMKDICNLEQSNVEKNLNHAGIDEVLNHLCDELQVIRHFLNINYLLKLLEPLYNLCERQDPNNNARDLLYDKIRLLSADVSNDILKKKHEISVHGNIYILTVLASVAFKSRSGYDYLNDVDHENLWYGSGDAFFSKFQIGLLRFSLKQVRKNIDIFSISQCEFMKATVKSLYDAGVFDLLKSSVFYVARSTREDQDNICYGKKIDDSTRMFHAMQHALNMRLKNIHGQTKKENTPSDFVGTVGNPATCSLSPDLFVSKLAVQSNQPKDKESLHKKGTASKRRLTHDSLDELLRRSQQQLLESEKLFLDESKENSKINSLSNANVLDNCRVSAWLRGADANPVCTEVRERFDVGRDLLISPQSERIGKEDVRFRTGDTNKVRPIGRRWQTGAKKFQFPNKTIVERNGWDSEKTGKFTVTGVGKKHQGISKYSNHNTTWKQASGKASSVFMEDSQQYNENKIENFSISANEMVKSISQFTEAPDLIIRNNLCGKSQGEFEVLGFDDFDEFSCHQRKMIK